eukprot:gene9656-11443_t
MFARVQRILDNALPAYLTDYEDLGANRGQRLIGLNRQIVRVGSLKKRTDTGRWKVVHVALVRGKLFFLNKPEADASVKGALSLCHASVVPDGDVSFDLRAGGRRTFFKVEGSRQERSMWLESFSVSVLLKDNDEPSGYIALREVAERRVMQNPTKCTHQHSAVPGLPAKSGETSEGAQKETEQGKTEDPPAVRNWVKAGAESGSRLGLSAHYFFNFTATLLHNNVVKGQRLLHLDVNAFTLEIVSKEIVKRSFNVSEISLNEEPECLNVEYENPEARSCKIKVVFPESGVLKSRNLWLYDEYSSSQETYFEFNSLLEKQLFTSVLEELQDRSFLGLSRFPREILHKGNIEKQRRDPETFASRFLVVIPMKLFLMRQKTSYFPSSTLSLTKGCISYDDDITIKVVAKKKIFVFRAKTQDSAAQWFKILLEASEHKVLKKRYSSRRRTGMIVPPINSSADLDWNRHPATSGAIDPEVEASLAANEVEPKARANTTGSDMKAREVQLEEACDSDSDEQQDSSEEDIEDDYRLPSNMVSNDPRRRSFTIASTMPALPLEVAQVPIAATGNALESMATAAQEPGELEGTSSVPNDAGPLQAVSTTEVDDAIEATSAEAGSDAGPVAASASEAATAVSPSEEGHSAAVPQCAGPLEAVSREATSATDVVVEHLRNISLEARATVTVLDNAIGTCGRVVSPEVTKESTDEKLPKRRSMTLDEGFGEVVTKDQAFAFWGANLRTVPKDE